MINLAEFISDLDALAGADLVLVCRVTDLDDECAMRFVDGRPSWIAVADVGTVRDEPIAVVEGSYDALIRFLAGASALNSADSAIRVVSNDIGPIMVLAGILGAPSRILT